MLWLTHSKSNSSAIASRTRISAKIARRVLNTNAKVGFGSADLNASLVTRLSRSAGKS
jgi:hypothetical protein